MPTVPYKNKQGIRLPSVTTILGRFKDSGGLIYWAWGLGRDGVTLDDAKKEACSAGSLVHQWIEDTLRGKPLSPAGPVTIEVLEKAQNAYQQFLTWRSGFDVNVTHTEVSLTSERYQFGGTLDGAAMAGHRIILDWKASNGLYPDYLLQCAAYALLWEENYGEQIDEAHILRVSKEDADFEHRKFSGLEDAKEIFISYAALYPKVKKLEKRVR